jgi:hypothetical protein
VSRLGGEVIQSYLAVTTHSGSTRLESRPVHRNLAAVIRGVDTGSCIVVCI